MNNNSMNFTEAYRTENSLITPRMLRDTHGRHVFCKIRALLSLDYYRCRINRSKSTLATSQEETYARIILRCLHICEIAPNYTLPIFNLVFDPLTLACCFYFLKMLRIRVLAQSFSLILAQATHTKKTQ